ncbi:MAG: hypothetical protein IKT33_02350 [Clostridia bacterium]|nr:hypothetical protein [Clostridia bacterium]
MNEHIKEIAEKFLQEEGISTKASILMASLGLNKSAGDIADIAYGINFNQHAYNEERQKQMVEYLGYAMLNWQILALSTGLSADEIAKRFAAEWLTKRTGKASIKDLLKHLKTPTRAPEMAQHINRPTTTAQPTPTKAKTSIRDFTREL